MDASVKRVDALRQLVHVGALQFCTGAVLEDLPHHRVCADDFQERLLVRRILPGCRRLGAGCVELQLVEQKFADLLRGVDVQFGIAGGGADGLRKRHDLLVQLETVGTERGGVDFHAHALHFRENRHEGFLALGQCLQRAGGGDLRTQRFVELERHVGILRRVVAHVRRGNVRHVLLLLATLAFADQSRDRDGVVAQVLAGEEVHVVERGGVEHVVLQHRVANRGTETDTVAGEHGHVEFRVLRDERLAGVGERSRERGDEREGGGVALACGACGLEEVLRGRRRLGGQEVRRNGHVPRLPLRRRERHPHEPGRARVDGRRFGVEGELRRGLQFARERGRLVKRLHEAILVRHVGERLEGGLRRQKRVLAEETPRQGVEFELRADSAELLGVRLLAEEFVERDVQRHVGADGREELGRTGVLGAGRDLLGEFSLQFGGVVDEVLHGTVLGEERGGGLLAHAAHAGDVVRRIAREREPVDHLPRRSELPVLAHFRLVVDFRVAAAAAGAEQADVRGHELRGVLVRRGEVHVKPLVRRAHGKRAHHVVRLKPVLAQHGDAERLGELERVRDGGGEVFGHLLALRLVRRIGLMAERGAAGVHGQHRVRGGEVLEDRGHAVRESEQRGRVDARRRHARVLEKHEMPAVEERHQVDDEQFLHAEDYITSATKAGAQIREMTR